MRRPEPQDNGTGGRIAQTQSRECVPKKIKGSNARSARERKVLIAKAIEALEPEYGLKRMFEVTRMARSTYYYVLKSLRRPDKYAPVRAMLETLHKRNKGRYGYRRMCAALRAEGFDLNHKTVRRLMRQQGIECTVRRTRNKRGPRPGSAMAASPNLLAGRFHAEAPFLKAVTDVTEFDIGGRRIYMSVLLDLYDGAVMSVSVSTSNNTDLITAMFRNMTARNRKRLKGMMVHSDQGVLYRSRRYHELVKSLDITQSMSRRGNYYDNALVESFFGTFKSESLARTNITTFEQLEREIKDYVRYYNTVRLKSTLGYMSPSQYRISNGFEKIA